MGTPGIYLDGDDTSNTLYGTGGDDSIGGFGGVDSIFDGRGDDFVFAGSGNDSVNAGMGNDWFDGGVGIDAINFAYFDVNFDGSVKELNTAGIIFDLARTTQNLGVMGTDSFFNFEDVNGTIAGDRLYGNAGANTINAGAGGNDIVDGRGGNDFLIAGPGSDKVTGGAGADRMYAGFATNDGARDYFLYTATAQSGTTAATRDIIVDFHKSADATGDRIDLRRIDANPAAGGNQAFSFVAGFHATKYGEVKVTYSGANTIVVVDIDRDPAMEMSILVQNAHLTKADFIL